MAGTRFTARKLRNGQWEIAGLDVYIRGVISHLLRHFRPAAAKARTLVSAPKPKKENGPLEVILASLAQHPRKIELLRAGKQKDQLLRSLIPLYVVKKHDVSINSGTISRFWHLHGVHYAPPNAAKALREHVGYARLAKDGRQITPNGIRYVETALAQRRAA